MEEDKVKGFVKFQVRRKITNLYKNFLFILEDLKDKKYYNSEEEYQKTRKRVLDLGNDLIRDIEETLDNVDVKLK
jgi:hypothetical protein|tara:strand:- start:1076 stop:1300 length:225 start_codon:yes stop_codon:yes gene_type:complete